MSQTFRNAYDPSTYDYNRSDNNDQTSFHGSMASRMAQMGPEHDQPRYRDQSEKRHQAKLKKAQILFWCLMSVAAVIMMTTDSFA